MLNNSRRRGTPPDGTRKYIPIRLSALISPLIAFASPDAESASAPPDSTTVLDERLEEVVVWGESARQRLSAPYLGVERLELERMASLPVLFGENDIIKSITLLPGITSEGEGAGGFEVRGGNSSQNLILMDGIALYNPSHVMGIFSTFNYDALASATMLKGPVPAMYGGASSAVLDTSLKRGDMEAYHASASIGLLSAKIAAEGPIVKDRMSFSVAARRSYVDLFLGLVPQYRGTEMNFYDVSAKLSFVPRYGNYLDVSFMVGHDNMALKDLMGMYWGNLGASVNWSARLGEKWMSITTGSFTDYSPFMDMTLMGLDQSMREYIHNFSLNQKFVFTLDDSRRLNFGFRSELQSVMSGEFDFNGNLQRDVRSGWQNALWGSFEGDLNSRWGVAAGVRLALFSTLTGDGFSESIYFNEPVPELRSRSYFIPEPRLSVRYSLSQSHSFKAGAGYNAQFIHALRASSMSTPFDRFTVSSDIVKPQNTLQYVAGYAGMTESGDFDWSAEIYWKDIRNVYDFKDGMNMMSATDLTSIIAGGKGRSYGVELMFSKNNGPLSGWISYTLSKTLTKIPGINNGEWYDASNDRRHNISVVASYRINPRWNVSATWSYLSGHPITAPDVKYELSGTTVYYYSARNSYSTPATHHLDLSAKYTRKWKQWSGELSFGIYNAYGRLNPFIIYFEDDTTRPSGTRAVQQSLYGMIPSVSYTLKF